MHLTKGNKFRDTLLSLKIGSAGWILAFNSVIYILKIPLTLLEM